MSDRAKLYFRAPDGAEYRVHDAIFTGGKHRRVPLGDSRAQYRIFTTGKSPHRSYKFKTGESRDVSEALLEKQLKQAEFAGFKPFDSTSRADPR